MPETTGTAAVQDDSPSFAEFVGDLHGDFLTDEPESNAGASPAATPDKPTSEGTEAASAEATPADAGTVPDQTTTPESDPLEGSAPLSYTVNGEARSFEGITKLKEGGAIVDPEAVALLERRLGERDHLFEASRAQHEQLETLTKLTEWPVTGPNGQTQLVSGREGVEAQRVMLGTLGAEVKELWAALRDPQVLANLLLIEPDGQGGSRIVGINEDALKGINRNVNLAQREISLQVRSRMAQYGATTQAASAPSNAFDATAVAPKAVETAISEAKVTGLTKEDKEFLRDQAPRYIRQATRDDVRAVPTLSVGEPIVDFAFIAVVKDRAQLRQSAAQQVAAASEANKTNQANIAAALVGKRVTPRQPIAEPKEPTPAKQREAEEDAAADARAITSARLMRQPA